jgi:uncharacterized membrane protein
MKHHLKNIITKHLKADIDALPEIEKRVAQHFHERLPISRNMNNEVAQNVTFGQRLADKVATFGGTWTFIMIFGAIMLFWVLLNAFILIHRGDTFDPYPYILLNLFLSMLAAIQAPIILMSQNRQSVKDRMDATHDYEVNLKAELEILSLHEKIDGLREKSWTELIVMQQEQIRLLMQLLKQRMIVKEKKKS